MGTAVSIGELRRSCRWGAIRGAVFTLATVAIDVIYWVALDGVVGVVVGVLMAAIALTNGVMLVRQVRLYRKVCELDRMIKSTDSLSRFLQSSPMPKNLAYGIAMRERRARR